jgi:hypothetical protein
MWLILISCTIVCSEKQHAVANIPEAKMLKINTV